jgi:predicted nucleic acid-binding protein
VNRVFVDSGFLLAVVWAGDTLHDRAMKWQAHLDEHVCDFVTTEAVLWESLNAMREPGVRHLAALMYHAMHSHPRVTVIPFSDDWTASAMKLYRDRADKRWSLTDCLSFQVMARLGITQALAHDHHFEQAGYTALLRADPHG